MKFWKKWPYWLRGGVIGGGISLLFIGVTTLCTTSSTGYGAIGCLVFFIPIAYLPGLLLQFYASVFYFGDPGLFAETHIFYTVVPFWFFVGSLIGALVGYVISKKKNKVH